VSFWHESTVDSQSKFLTALAAPFRIVTLRNQKALGTTTTHKTTSTPPLREHVMTSALSDPGRLSQWEHRMRALYAASSVYKVPECYPCACPLLTEKGMHAVQKAEACELLQRSEQRLQTMPRERSLLPVDGQTEERGAGEAGVGM
jgi:hypothetical protein